jgi:hypothetical protein
MRPVVQDPRDPVRGPGPVKGAGGSVIPGIMNGVATMAGGIGINDQGKFGLKTGKG